jgi:DNA-binding HxlR family transcriptional regulator
MPILVTSYLLVKRVILRYPAEERRKLPQRNEMARKYDLKCPIAGTLDIIGDRWAILILRDLFLHGARRFQDFEATLPGLTPSVLSARLKSLEADEVVATRSYEVHPPRLEYYLTPKGRELGPILRAIRSWGEKHA